jgi:hypothetical protein
MSDEAQAVPPPKATGEPLQVQKEATPEEARALIPVVPSTGGIVQMELTDSLRELSEVRGQAGMVLLLSHVNKLEGDNRELRNERMELKDESKGWMQRYYTEKEEHAVAKQQLRGVSQIKNIQRFVGAVGGLVAGCGGSALITASAGQITGWMWGATIIGALLFIAGFWPTNVKDKPK